MRSRIAAAIPFVALVVAHASCTEGDGAAGGGISGGSGGGGGDVPSTGIGGDAGAGGSTSIQVVSPEVGTTPSATGSSTTGPSTGPGGGDPGGGGGPPDDMCTEPSTYDVTAYATVDDSNSYASPMLVRELTGDSSWKVGDPLPVRAHEFLNAYGQKIVGGLYDQDIDDSLHVGVDARVDPHLDHLGRRLVRLAVSLTSFNAAETAVPDVTFVMDASSSMSGEPVERLQAVLRGAGRTISVNRSVAAVTTKGGGTVVRSMDLWNGDVETISSAAAELDAQANLEPTLELAFDIARAQADDTSTPGVVLLVTDGTNPLGTTIQERIARERELSPPVRVVGVGVGPARGYVDELLDTVTDESGGAYFYAPSKEAAEEELAARFSSLTQIAARGVRLELDVPAAIEVVGVAGSEPPSNDEPGLQDGQNLGADSSMIFQIYLLAPASLDCPTVGLSMSWTDPSAPDAGLRRFPANEMIEHIPIWERFAVTPTPSESYQRIEAILAAADAMRGPTPTRIQVAVDALDTFLTSGVPGDPVKALCGPLSRFCLDKNVDCRVCAQP